MRTPGFGGHGGGETPGPIPNPEVKPSSADGTARATGWESRSLPRHRANGPPFGAARSVSTYPRATDADVAMPKSLKPRAGARPKGTPPKRRSCLATSWRRSGARPPTALATRRDVAAGAGDRAARARRPAAAPWRRRRRPRRLAPRSPRVREVLGLAYYGVGRWQDALTELKAYKRITGRVDQNHLIADCLRGPGAARRGGAARGRGAARPRGAERGEGRGRDRRGVGARRHGQRYAEALAFLARARTREDVARGLHAAAVVRARRHPRSARGDPTRRRRSSARSMRHDPSAFDAAERLVGAGLSLAHGLAFPALAPVAREPLRVHPDRAERVVALLPSNGAVARRSRTPCAAWRSRAA